MADEQRGREKEIRKQGNNKKNNLFYLIFNSNLYFYIGGGSECFVPSLWTPRTPKLRQFYEAFLLL